MTMTFETSRMTYIDARLHRLKSEIAVELTTVRVDAVCWPIMVAVWLGLGSMSTSVFMSATAAVAATVHLLLACKSIRWLRQLNRMRREVDELLREPNNPCRTPRAQR